MTKRENAAEREILMSEFKKPSAKVARLLRRVIRHIKAEPRRLAMNTWFHAGVKESFEIYDPNFNDQRDVPPCGTAGCIAGWVAALGAPTKRPRTAGGVIRRTAIRLLGIKGSGAYNKINADEANPDYAGDRLFFVESWPHRFRHIFNGAKTHRGRTAATIKRIEHFIKTGE